MFGFITKSEPAPVPAPSIQNGPFWSSWFSAVRGVFFARGPTKLQGGAGSGSTGLVQGGGDQGNYGAGTSGAFAALQISTVWACVRLLAEIVGTLPVGVYRRQADGGRTEERDHPASVVLQRPNRTQTRVEWLEQQMLNILTDGNCYDVPVRIGGRIMAIHPLAAAQVDVDLAPNGGIKYTFHPETGGVRTYTDEEVMQVRLFGNSLKGLSPLGYARTTLAAAAQLQQNGANLAAKGNKPSGILMVDHVFKPGQRDAIRESFKELEANNTRLFVLEAGFKYQPLTISPEDAQMVEQMKLSVGDICRIYRVPSYMVNDSEKATTWGSGLEQMNLAFLTYTLRPYLVRFEQVWNNDLLTDEERAAGLYIEFNLEALLRADSAGRAAFYASMEQNGNMTRNEVRRKENLPASLDANADALTVQSNLVPLSKLGLTPPTQTPKEGA